MTLLSHRENLEKITRRPRCDADEPFLCALYATTRADEMTLLPWSQEQKDAFVRMQFDAQTTHYRTFYPTAQYEIIERAGEPIGRLIVYRAETELELVDIALLPAYCGQGIGTYLTQPLLEEAAASGRSVRAYVWSDNRALRFYVRLGFLLVQNDGIYSLLEWRALA